MAGKGNRAALAGRLDAVEDGIFHQRLKRELDNAQIEQFGGDFIDKGESFHIAHVLNGNIVAQKRPFFPQRDFVLGTFG